MALAPPTKDERDANLDALKEAVDTWVEDEKTRLENEVNFMRKVMEGRGAATDAGTTNLATAGDVVVAEIDAFLIFDEGDEGAAQ
jgi:hypothetical protein